MQATINFRQQLRGSKHPQKYHQTPQCNSFEAEDRDVLHSAAWRLQRGRADSPADKDKIGDERISEAALQAQEAGN